MIGMLVITSKVKILKSIHNIYNTYTSRDRVGNYLESKNFEINSQQYVGRYDIYKVGNYLESKNFEINSQLALRLHDILLGW